MKAWHFLREDGRLQFPPHIDVRVGETLRHDGPLKMCASGLHASRRAIDALQYAPGPVVCRVEVSGEIVQGDDKLVASERTVLWMYDARAVLRNFARLCALDVLHLWGTADVVVRYLRSGDESLRPPAWPAAWGTAWAAAWAAAGAAAGAAAWPAAWAKQERRLSRMLREGRP